MQKHKKPESVTRSDAFRLAEVMQMKRIEFRAANGTVIYYECKLCLGKSNKNDPASEIEHAQYCPLNRL